MRKELCLWFFFFFFAASNNFHPKSINIDEISNLTNFKTHIKISKITLFNSRQDTLRTISNVAIKYKKNEFQGFLTCPRWNLPTPWLTWRRQCNPSEADTGLKNYGNSPRITVLKGTKKKLKREIFSEAKRQTDGGSNLQPC